MELADEPAIGSNHERRGPGRHLVGIRRAARAFVAGAWQIGPRPLGSRRSIEQHAEREVLTAPVSS